MQENRYFSVDIFQDFIVGIEIQHTWLWTKEVFSFQQNLNHPDKIVLYKMITISGRQVIKRKKISTRGLSVDVIPNSSN